MNWRDHLRLHLRCVVALTLLLFASICVFTPSVQSMVLRSLCRGGLRCFPRSRGLHRPLRSRGPRRPLHNCGLRRSLYNCGLRRTGKPGFVQDTTLATCPPRSERICRIAACSQSDDRRPPPKAWPIRQWLRGLGVHSIRGTGKRTWRPRPWGVLHGAGRMGPSTVFPALIMPIILSAFCRYDAFRPMACAYDNYSH